MSPLRLMSVSFSSRWRLASICLRSAKRSQWKSQCDEVINVPLDLFNESRDQEQDLKHVDVDGSVPGSCSFPPDL